MKNGNEKIKFLLFKQANNSKKSVKKKINFECFKCFAWKLNSQFRFTIQERNQFKKKNVKDFLFELNGGQLFFIFFLPSAWFTTYSLHEKINFDKLALKSNKFLPFDANLKVLKCVDTGISFEYAKKKNWQDK